MSDIATQPLLETSARQLDELESLAETLAGRVVALREALVEREARLAEMEQQLSVAEARLALEKMHAEGLSAQASLLLAEGLASAGEPTDALDAEGLPKTRLTLAYEAAFDAKGEALGIVDPARFRSN